MLLNEFIYFTKDQQEQQVNDRYDPLHDTSVLKASDLRKTRLTLRMLNDLRKAGDAREREQQENLIVIKQMYKMPTEQPVA
jgi:hypothetical protein